MKDNTKISLNIVNEISQYFGNESFLTIGSKIQLLKLGLSGSINYAPIRALCWRVYLGILSTTNKCLWANEIEEQYNTYIKLKNHTMTSLDQVSIDPLTAMLNNSNNSNNEWNQYYKNVELTNFIVKDLDRLFITGISLCHIILYLIICYCYNYCM